MDYALAQLSAQQNYACDAPAALTDFDGARYMGTWYEQQHRAGQVFQSDTDVCTEALYSNLQSDGSFDVYNTGERAGFGDRHGIDARGKCPDSTGQCYVAFYSQNPQSPNYLVVDTDYESYSIVYACGVLKPYLWFLTRDAVISDSLYNQMVATAKAQLPHFNFSWMADRTVQSNSQCSYIQSESDFFWAQ